MNLLSSGETSSSIKREGAEAVSIARPLSVAIRFVRCRRFPCGPLIGLPPCISAAGVRCALLASRVDRFDDDHVLGIATYLLIFDLP